MAFLLTRPSAMLGLGLGTSLCLSPLSPFRASPMQCQYASPYYRPEGQHQHQAAQTGWGIPLDDPSLVKQGRTKTSGSSRSNGGLLTARNMRQVSLGSVLGLVAGVGLRAFSRVLAVVIGMGIVFVEWAASRGYNLIPTSRLQRYVRNTNLHRALSTRVPFKASFGITMTLAAFAQF